MRISICQSPHGYRDVYWCESINEPALLNYEGDVGKCSVCGGRIDVKDAEEAENAGHSFLFHISNGNHNAKHCELHDKSVVIQLGMRSNPVI
jgi:hypothetical protein